MKNFISLLSVSFISLSIIAQNQVNLSLNLKQGNIYRLKSSSVTSMSQTIMDRPQTSENKAYSVMSVKPLSLDSNAINAEIKFDSIGFTNSMPQMDVSSSKPGLLSSSDASMVMNVILNRLSKSPILVKLSNTGKVLGFSNFKTITDSVLAGIDTLKNESAFMVKLMAKKMVSEESIKGMIEINTAYLPGKMVQPGDKWDTQVKISNSGIGIIVKSSYKLKKVTGNQAEIKGDVTSEPASSEPVDMGEAQITYNARGLGEVTLVADTNTGWIIKGTSRTHAQGNIGVNYQGQEFEVPTEIDANSETVAIP